jgi:hypothetical protein
MQPHYVVEHHVVVHHVVTPRPRVVVHQPVVVNRPVVVAAPPPAPVVQPVPVAVPVAAPAPGQRPPQSSLPSQLRSRSSTRRTRRLPPRRLHLRQRVALPIRSPLLAPPKTNGPRRTVFATNRQLPHDQGPYRPSHRLNGRDYSARIRLACYARLSAARVAPEPPGLHSRPAASRSMQRGNAAMPKPPSRAIWQLRQ